MVATSRGRQALQAQGLFERSPGPAAVHHVELLAIGDDFRTADRTTLAPDTHSTVKEFVPVLVGRPILPSVAELSEIAMFTDVVGNFTGCSGA